VAYAAAEKDKCSLLEEFCDAVLRESSRRAVTVGTPLSYQQVRERWRDMAGTKRFSQQRQPQVSKAGQQSVTGGDGGGGSAKTGPPVGGGFAATVTRPPAAGDAGRGAAVKFNGELVCYHYNNVGRGCTRPPKGAGCDNGRGGSYAHVCNFKYGNGVHCLAKHTHHANH
jgi:hypothetical protein